jgi:hypothetical protein
VIGRGSAGDLEPLVEPFAQLGLSVALAAKGLDPQQIR